MSRFLTLFLIAISAQSADLESVYKWLHTNPELSYAEKQTSKRFADELRAAGFEVTENIGGHGVVGVFKNGPGKTLLYRTDLDALPVKEQTGLPYASKAVGKDDAGNDVPVMHACGHDIHMTCMIGAARELSRRKGDWTGTLVIIGQPAEERLGGAQGMIKQGLFARFPKPDFCVALHVASDLPAGKLSYTEGFATANMDSIDITVRGIGGHGAWPHKTKDPIVLAAQIVLALQTIVSREIDPTESAVVTVGSVHGGAKRNVISDKVVLELTLRSYAPEVRKQLIAAIRRVCDGAGRAAGLPDNLLPIVTETGEAGPAVYNDPTLTRTIVKAMAASLGSDNLVPTKPVMGSEDFSEYGLTPEKVPIALLWLGAVKAETYAAAEREKKPLPSLHSPFFAPDPAPTIKTGVQALTAAALNLLAK
jgi:amidohydrolase